MRIKNEHLFFYLSLLANKKPRTQVQGLAFGIDRNQESFFLKTTTPTDAARVAVNCKKFRCLRSLGL